MTGDSILYPGQATVVNKPSFLWWRRFFIRLRSWEYWPVYIFNLPVLGIWLWNAIKARDLFFFTLTNPGIPTGGFFGESKSAILHHIPAAYKPKTILLKAGITEKELADIIQQAGFQYPIIAKPEVGERGWLIKKIHSFDQLTTYLGDHPIDIILQSFVTLPLELSIMIYQMPEANEAVVTSVCEKHYLQIRGDGQSTIGELINAHDRALLQFEKLSRNFGHRWNEVLPTDEICILEPIGNHCRGTMFLDRNNEIDADIVRHISLLLHSMPEVYYGRFDLKVGSWASLREGRDIQVLEFNGTSSDPAHIYQPGYPLRKAYSDMAFHWKVMVQIARQNKRLGHAPVTFKKIISALILYFRYKRAN